VLVVEDAEAIRVAVSSALAAAGLEVRGGASTSPDAVAPGGPQE
jgi:hypothetical protein